MIEEKEGSDHDSDRSAAAVESEATLRVTRGVAKRRARTNRRILLFIQQKSSSYKPIIIDHRIEFSSERLKRKTTHEQFLSTVTPSESSSQIGDQTHQSSTSSRNRPQSRKPKHQADTNQEDAIAALLSFSRKPGPPTRLSPSGNNASKNSEEHKKQLPEKLSSGAQITRSDHLKRKIHHKSPKMISRTESVDDDDEDDDDDDGDDDSIIDEESDSDRDDGRKRCRISEEDRSSRESECVGKESGLKNSSLHVIPVVSNGNTQNGPGTSKKICPLRAYGRCARHVAIAFYIYEQTQNSHDDPTREARILKQKARSHQLQESSEPDVGPMCISARPAGISVGTQQQNDKFSALSFNSLVSNSSDAVNMANSNDMLLSTDSQFSPHAAAAGQNYQRTLTDGAIPSTQRIHPSMVGNYTISAAHAAQAVQLLSQPQRFLQQKALFKNVPQMHSKQPLLRQQHLTLSQLTQDSSIMFQQNYNAGSFLPYPQSSVGIRQPSITSQLFCQSPEEQRFADAAQNDNTYNISHNNDITDKMKISQRFSNNTMSTNDLQANTVSSSNSNSILLSSQSRSRYNINQPHHNISQSSQLYNNLANFGTNDKNSTKISDSVENNRSDKLCRNEQNQQNSKNVDELINKKTSNTILLDSRKVKSLNDENVATAKSIKSEENKVTKRLRSSKKKLEIR